MSHSFTWYKADISLNIIRGMIIKRKMCYINLVNRTYFTDFIGYVSEF